MSLGLDLLAHLSQACPDPEHLIQQLEAWLHRTYSDMLPQTSRETTDAVPALFCQLHPAAEEFQLSLVGPAQLVASSNASILGPGITFSFANSSGIWLTNSMRTGRHLPLTPRSIWMTRVSSLQGTRKAFAQKWRPGLRALRAVSPLTVHYLLPA
jgi:hypothetical protein